MYAGLTTADKGALLDAKADGCEWISRDDISDDLCGFDVKPFKNRKHGRWYARKLKHISHLDSKSLQFIQWSDAEPVNIDLALAQIAEMESKPIDESATDDIVLAEVYSLREKLKIAADIIHKLDPNYDVTEFLHQVGSADYDQREEDLAPLTWNERINQMTVSEKADWMKDNDFCIVMKLPENGCFEFNSCTECLETWLNSPYTEGETR